MHYCPEDEFRNPANAFLNKKLSAVLAFFDLNLKSPKTLQRAVPEFG